MPINSPIKYLLTISAVEYGSSQFRSSCTQHGRKGDPLEFADSCKTCNSIIQQLRDKDEKASSYEPATRVGDKPKETAAAPVKKPKVEIDILDLA